MPFPGSSHGLRAFVVWFSVLFAILVSLNILLAPHDAGWLSANATPFLIVPVLLGVRHGPIGGCLSGVMVAAPLLGIISLNGLGAMVPENHYPLLALPLLGCLVGWATRHDGEHIHKLRLERDLLFEENRHYAVERELLVLSRQDLQQRLESHGADTSAMDQQFADLPEEESSFFPATILEGLAQVTQMTDAAVYELPTRRGSESLIRVSSIGDMEFFPEYLLEKNYPIISEALARGCFLVQKSLLEAPPVRRPGYLAAYPICGPDRAPSHLLVVKDLARNKINVATFDLMKAVCDRVVGSSRGRKVDGITHRAISQLEFYAAIERAVETHECYAIPSTLARIPFDVRRGADLLESFRELLEILPKQTLLSNYQDDGQQSLLFLLPANSDPAVRDGLRDLVWDFVADQRIAERGPTRFVMTRPDYSPQQLWGELMAPDPDVASH